MKDITVSRQPFLNYLTALTVVLKKEKECLIKARGRYIFKAIDLVEVTRNKLMKDLVVENVIIGSVQVPDRKKKEKKVRFSTIEIRLKIK